MKVLSSRRERNRPNGTRNISVHLLAKIFQFHSVLYFLSAVRLSRNIFDPFFEQRVTIDRGQAASPRHWPTREHPVLLRSYSRFSFKVFIGQ